MKRPIARRRPSLAAAALALAALAAPCSTSFAQPTRWGSIALPVTGYNRVTGQALFGSFTLTDALIASGGELQIQGVVHILGLNAQMVQLPVAVTQATCAILDVELGPLNANLLSLDVHLNPVHMVIEGNPQGGQLGQSLCGVAGVMSRGGRGLASQVADHLNHLLALFR